jgi:hypothetical protein
MSELGRLSTLLNPPTEFTAAAVRLDDEDDDLCHGPRQPWPDTWQIMETVA